MLDFAIVLPVGPGHKELDRVADLMDSIRCYEPQTPTLLFIDDALEDRQLAQKFRLPRHCTAVSIPNPRRGRGVGDRGGLCVANMVALAWLCEHANVKFAVKMDSDALVIGPFAQKLHQAFEGAPEAGIIGSAHMLTCNREPTKFEKDGYSMRKLLSPIAVWREPLTPGQHLQISLSGKLKTVRTHVLTAMKRGYRPGEHCQGGAYAVSSQFIRRMATRGYLQDLLLWRDIPCCEDVMMGMYARAVGLHLKDFNNTHQVFGIQHMGLPDTLERLIERGYSLIHSLKNDPRFSEEQIREFYRIRRAAVATYEYKRTLFAEQIG
jgi:hypothetical protein